MTKIGTDVVTIPNDKIPPGLISEIEKILADRYQVKNITLISDSVRIEVLFVCDNYLKTLSKTVLLAKLPEGVESGVGEVSSVIHE